MNVEAEPHEPELRDYLRTLWRRKAVIALALIVVAGGAMTSAYLQTPLYASTAQVLRQSQPKSLFDTGSGAYVDPTRALQTEILILLSQPVRDRATQKLGFRGAITASPEGQTDVIAIRAEDPVARRAADIANAFANAYIEYRRTQDVDDVLNAATEVQGKIRDLQKQIDSTTGAQRDTLIQQQALFSNRLDQLQVDASIQTGGAQLVASAQVPTVPFAPRPLRSGVIAAVLGLLLGVGLAFLLEYLDDSVKTKDDFERAAPNVGVLALIPSVTGWKPKDDPVVVSVTEPSSPAAEAYRTLRTAVQFLGVDRPVRAIQVTSANAHEGKTTTLANLGVALARAGQRVVIVCSDLRRPRVHEFFGLDNTKGFTSVLLGETSLSQALQRVPGVERLYLLASGPLPPNPSELLQSRRAAEIFTTLEADGNFLLIDSPPILPVTDGLVLSKRVDGTLIVCNAGKTSKKEVGRTLELLQQVDAPIIGAVLNGVSPESAYGYTYGYGYYRAADSSSTNGNGKNGNGHGKSRSRSRSGSEKAKR